MKEQIDIDQILEKHYDNACDNYRGIKSPLHYSAITYNKQAIKEIVERTLAMAADEAEVEVEEVSMYGVTYRVNTESILSTINQIKF